MSDTDVCKKVLEVLRQETGPMRPGALYAKLRTMQIDEPQSRRAVVSLAADHKIEVTPDRQVLLSPDTERVAEEEAPA